ncbi:MAG: hypothetical protein ATN31_06915 [Candidatus Epulonipiscioides saccharophilum]|nr:MAG: hypothetical protein ATN31_06915 [Epulopiscium sp. AS2M-Bin001]
MEIWCRHEIFDEDFCIVEENPPGFLRIFKAENGNFLYKSDDEEVLLQEGRIYVCPTHTAYSIKNISGNKCKCLVIQRLARNYLLDKLIDLGYEEIYMLTITLIEKLFEKENFRGVMHGVRIIIEKCVGDGLILKVHETFQNILATMQKYACKNISVSEFAKMFGYSNEHFIRIFTKEIKTTPYQYLLNIKMGKAREFLYSGRSVRDVASLTGYSDTKSFNKAFKTRYGITASEYKKNYNTQGKFL